MPEPFGVPGMIGLRRLEFLTFAVAVGHCTIGVAQESVVLRPNWEPGQTTYIEWGFEGTYTFPDVAAPEPNPRVTLTETTGLFCKVADRLPSGGVRLAVTFERFAQSDKAKGQRTGCDSDTDDLSASSDPLCRVKHVALGMSYAVEIDGTGRVVRVEGLAVILDAAKRASNDKDARLYAAAVFDEQTHATLWNMFCGPYAFKEVKVGDTWSRTIQTYRGPDRYDYTVNRMGKRDGRRVVVVDYTIEASPTTVTQPAETLEGVRYEKRETQGHGMAVFDVERGEFVEFQETGKERARRVEVSEGTRGGTARYKVVTWQRRIIILPQDEREKQKAQRQSREANP